MTPRLITSTFDELVRSAAEPELWRALPQRLGLVSSAAGSWDDFIRLWPNRDLPAFVADAIPANRQLSDAALAAFSRAHHYAAMLGIVLDRAADGQCNDPQLPAVRRLLLAGWIEQLAAGVGDVTRARARIASALRAFRRGLALERKLLTAEHDWQAYTAAVVLRLRWVSTSAVAMLETAHADAAARALEHTYDQFLLALQVLDDHDDRIEDLRCRGSSFALPQQLALGPRALAGMLVSQAARAAMAGTLERLARWLAEFASLLWQVPMRSR